MTTAHGEKIRHIKLSKWIIFGGGTHDSRVYLWNIYRLFIHYSPRQHRRENTSPSHGEQHVTLQQAQGSCPARKLGLMDVLWTLRFI